MKSENYLIKSDFVYRDENPLIASSAFGSTLIMHDGKTIIDLEAANGAALFGYDSTIVDHAAKSLSHLPMIPSFVEADLRINLAKRFCQFIHRSCGEWGRVAFELGGAQGIELAIKFASQVNPNKKTILVLDGCYHGRSLVAANLSCSLRYSKDFNGSPFNIVRLPVPGLMSGDIKAQQQFCSQYIESLFSDERCGLTAQGYSDVLCFIYEPVLNVSGLLEPGREYIELIIEKTRQAGGVIISDEIFTGLYRLGQPFAGLREGMIADYMVFSKIISNGITPLSVVWGRNHVTSDDKILPGLHSSTFSNSLFAFSVAHQVMDRIENVTMESINRIENALVEMCKVMVSENKNFLDYQVNGLTAKVSLNNGVDAKDIKNKLVQGGIVNSSRVGVLTAYTGLAKSHIMMHPPLTISDEEIDLSIKILKQCK